MGHNEKVLRELGPNLMTNQHRLIRLWEIVTWSRWVTILNLVTDQCDDK